MFHLSAVWKSIPDILVWLPAVPCLTSIQRQGRHELASWNVGGVLQSSHLQYLLKMTIRAASGTAGLLHFKANYVYGPSLR